MSRSITYNQLTQNDYQRQKNIPSPQPMMPPPIDVNAVPSNTSLAKPAQPPENTPLTNNPYANRYNQSSVMPPAKSNNAGGQPGSGVPGSGLGGPGQGGPSQVGPGQVGTGQGGPGQGGVGQSGFASGPNNQGGSGQAGPGYGNASNNMMNQVGAGIPGSGGSNLGPGSNNNQNQRGSQQGFGQSNQQGYNQGFMIPQDPKISDAQKMSFPYGISQYPGQQPGLSQFPAQQSQIPIQGSQFPNYGPNQGPQNQYGQGSGQGGGAQTGYGQSDENPYMKSQGPTFRQKSNILESQVNDMQSKLVEQQEQLQNLKGAQNEARELRAQLLAQANDIRNAKALGQENQDLRDENEILHSQLLQYQQLDGQNKQLKDKLIALQNELNRLRIENERLAEDAQDVDVLRDEIDKYKGADIHYREIVQKNLALESELDQMHKNLANFNRINDDNQKFSHTIEQGKRDRDLLNQKNLQLQQERDQALLDNQKMKRLMDQLNADLKRCMAQIQDQQMVINQQKDENARLNDEAQYNKQELVKARGYLEQQKMQLNAWALKDQELQANKELINQLQAQQRAQMQKADGALKDFDDLQHQHKMQQEVLNKAQIDLENTRQQLRGLQEELWRLRDLDNKADGLGQDLTRVNSVLQQKSNEVEDMRAEILHLQGELRRVGDVDYVNKSLKEQLNELAINYDNTLKQKQKLELQAQQLNEASSRFQEVAQQKNLVQNDLNAWRNRCVELENEIRRLKDVEQRLVQAGELIQKMKIDLTNYAKRDQYMERELQKLLPLENDLQQANLRIQGLNQQLQDQKNEHENLKRRYVFLEAETAKAGQTEHELQNAQMQFQRYDAAMKEMAQQIENWKRRAAGLEQELSDAQGLNPQLQQSQLQNKHLQNTISELGNELQLWKTRCTQQENQIGQLQNKDIQSITTYQELERQKRDNQGLMNELEQQKQRYLQLEKELDKWKQRTIQLEQIAREGDSAKQRLATVEKQLQDTLSQGDSALKQMHEQQLKTQEEWRQRYLASEDQRRAIENALQEARLKNEYDQRQMKADQEALKQQLIKQNSEMEMWKTTCQDLDQMVKGISRDAENQLKGKEQGFGQELNFWKARSGKAEKELMNAQQQNEALRRDLEMLSNRVTLEAQTGAQLKEQLHRSENELNQLRLQTEVKLKGERDMLLQELEKAKMKISSLEAEKAQLNEHWNMRHTHLGKEAQNNHMTLQQQLEATKGELIATRQRLNEYEQELNRQGIANNQYTQTIQLLNEKLGHSQKDLAMQQIEQQRLQQRIASMESDGMRLKTIHETSLAEIMALKKRIEDLEIERMNLARNLQITEQNMKNLHPKYQSDFDRILTTKTLEFEAINKSLREELYKKEHYIKDLQNQLSIKSNMLSYSPNLYSGISPLLPTSNTKYLSNISPTLLPPPSTNLLQTSPKLLQPSTSFLPSTNNYLPPMTTTTPRYGSPGDSIPEHLLKLDVDLSRFGSTQVK